MSIKFVWSEKDHVKLVEGGFAPRIEDKTIDEATHLAYNHRRK